MTIKTMLRPASRALAAGVLAAFAVAPTTPAADARTGPEPVTVRGAERGAPTTPVTLDVDVRDLPRAPAWKPGDAMRDIPMRHYPIDGAALPLEPVGPDPLVDVQRAVATELRSSNTFVTPNRNFEGQGYTGVNPPDTVGDVGPDYFIQGINTGGGADIRIWDKSLGVPNEVASFRLDSLGSGQCASGFGDPIILYDRQAGRWMLTEFSGSGNELCVYISQTGDPVSGGWHAYGFQMPSFPDYPKYAVWATDANGGAGSYVVTANDGGPGVIALERGPMLDGQAATWQRLTMPALPGFGIQGPAPADPDGPLGPPAGEPAIVMRHRDTEVHSGPSAPGDLLEMWLFDVDWQDSANTTLTQAASIDVAEFDSTVCGTAFVGCFDQPGSSTQLMPIREVIMNRLQYYNHDGQFETLVGNYVVDVATNDQGGVRWFHLRRPPGGSWAVHQEGTYSIDAENRWMGSIALDQSENIALAYNVVSSTTYPSLRYTGRTFGAPLGVMDQPEVTIHAGTESNGSFRYGDYAAMTLDPADDCTFWFTGMDNTSSGWRTQGASFRFAACGCLAQPLAPTVDATLGGENRVDLFWNDSEQESVVEYRVRRSRTAGGPYETIATFADSSPGVASGPGYSYSDTTVSGDVTYYYVVDAGDGGACLSPPDNETEITPFGICLLPPSFDGVRSATSAQSATCTVDLEWDPATTECGPTARFDVYRSTTPGFTPDPSTLLVGGVSATSLTDLSGLVDDTTYHYVVRAVDPANGVDDGNSIELAVESVGPGTGVFTPLVESFTTAADFGAWTVATGPGQHTCGAFALSGNAEERPDGSSGTYARALSYQCQQLLPRTSTSLDSPSYDMQITGLVSVTLELDLYFRAYNGQSDATIEVWDGGTWQVVWSDEDQDLNARLSLDVSAAAVGNPEFRVRFNYQNAVNSGWFSADNVTLTTVVDNPCSAAPAPAAAGDGTTGGPPLEADRLGLNGDTLDVRWDASCGAAAYNLLWGDLAGVSGVTPTASVCGLGTTGQFTWSGVPSGDLWFLVVGSDDVDTESSWGRGTAGERNALDASGLCATTRKNIAAVCQ